MKIDLTIDQLNRLRDIVATHVDLLLQPKIDEAMEKKNETELTGLLVTKRGDQEILHKLWEAEV